MNNSTETCGYQTTHALRVAIVCDSFGDTPEWVSAELLRHNIVSVVEPCRHDDDIVRVAVDAHVVWLIGGGPVFTEAALEGLPQCVAIVRSGSGVDNVPFEGATRRNIMVINTPRATAGPVAEGAIALMLAAHRRLVLQDRLMRRGVWAQFEHWPAAPLAGLTLGLVGFGHIAREVARRMIAFDMNLIVHDPAVPAQVIESLGAAAVSFDHLLQASDILSLHCPLLPTTRHLINREALAKMKTSALLVNSSRGPVVHEAALIEALQQGLIAGAALDTFEIEPLPDDSPLRALDNVVLSPHTTAHHQRIGADFRRLGLESIVALARGHWPDSCLNRHRITPRIAMHESLTPIGVTP